MNCELPTTERLGGKEVNSIPKIQKEVGKEREKRGKKRDKMKEEKEASDRCHTQRLRDPCSTSKM